MKADPPEIKKAKKEYGGQRDMALKRNIEFKLTFPEWYNFWIESGKYPQRGRGRGKYHMSRFGDIGPYSIDNIFVNLHEQNTIDAHLGKISPTKGTNIHSEEHKSKLKRRMVGNSYNASMPKLQCRYCGLIGVKPNINRWHNDNCKQRND